MPNATAEQFFRALFRGAPTTQAQSRATQFAGLTTVLSGTATATVSTTVVGSDSIIFLSPQAAAAVASGLGKSWEVRTKSPGNFFTIGTVDGIALARDTVVGWQLWKVS